MTTKNILLILPLTLCLTGCVIVAGDGEDGWSDDHNASGWRDEQNINRKNITKLTLGLEYPMVLTQMGNPDFTEAFTTEGGLAYQVLYYRTHREHGDGETTKDETTPLVFENNKLIGWGNDALQRIH